MFHLFKKIYLDHAFKFGIQHDLFAIDKKWANVVVLSRPIKVFGKAETLNGLLIQRYENDIEKFWTFLLTQDQRVHLYINHADRLTLQIQLWKSIFDKPSQEFVYLLHKFDVVNDRLKRYRHRVPDKRKNLHLYDKIPLLSETAFTQLYQQVSPSSVLEKMDKTLLGFEYLLGHYLATRKRSNVHYHEQFFERFGDLLWRRLLVDLDRMRECAFDIMFQWNEMFLDIDVEELDVFSLNLESIFKSLNNNKHLSWLIESTKDVEVLKTTFDPQQYTKLYQTLYPEHPSPLGHVTMLKDGAWEQLFNMDLDQKFGCSITQTHLTEKSNQLLISYLYSEGRKSTVSQLKDFILQSP